LIWGVLVKELAMGMKRSVIFLSLLFCGLSTAAPAFATTSKAPRQFRDWCLKADSMPTKTRNLIYAILKHSDTLDCDQVDRKLVDLEELKLLGNFDDLRPIAALKSLKRLSVNNYQGAVADLQPLSQMKQLTHLTVSGNVEDITPIAKLKNLTYLDLGSNRIRDIQPLSRLTNLTYLELRGNELSGRASAPELTREKDRVEFRSN
jgi:internalin A